MTIRRIALWGALVAGAPVFHIGAAFAQDAPLFERDVRPIFAKHCAGCHFPENGRVKSGMDLSTAEAALRGGDEGVSIIPGKSEESRLTGMLEWRVEPFMPPAKRFKQLAQEEIEVIKRWIAAGALTDPDFVPLADDAPLADPDSPAPTTPHPAPVTALAFGRAGGENLLAKGGLRVVTVFAADTATGALEERFTLEGHADLVRALSFSPDGALLAAGGGLPARKGEVKIWRVEDRSLVCTLEGHTDNVLDLAWSPDGRLLATASYDKRVIIWDVAAGEAARELKDHVDAVFAVAFHPDGTRLATGAGDRAVKIWDVATGEMLLTITDSLEAVYALAYSPSGQYLAGAGADKMIRVWKAETTKETFSQSEHTSGTLALSSFAHGAPVLALAYSPDGTALYSASEDRRIKMWRASDLSEARALPDQPDWAQALAVSPDGALLAVGRFDSTTTIYATATGEALSGWGADEPVKLAAAGGRKRVTTLDVDAVIIRANVPPSIERIAPDRWHRGAEAELELEGKNLDAAEIIASHPALHAEILSSEAGPEPDLSAAATRSTAAQILDNARPYKLKLKLVIAADAPLGRHELMLRTPHGMTNPVGFQVILKPDLGETEPNDMLDQAQLVEWPNVVIGQINTRGDIDRYRVSAKAGDELVVVLTDHALSPTMRILGASGAVLAQNTGFQDRFGFHAEADGGYIVEIQDKQLREGLGYRLHIGAFPMVTEVWPLGVPAGEPGTVTAKGFNLGALEFTVDPPDSATYDSRLTLPIPAIEGSPIPLPQIAVGPGPDVFETPDNNAPQSAQATTWPVAINGRIATPGEADYYRFHAKTGERIIIEIMAARLGSPLDSRVEILDTNGEPLQRGVIRCVAQTEMTLSERDSKSGGFRVSSWRDMRMNDYLMAGGEIVRIDKIPDYGDEDVVLKTYANGQRIGYFGTTPEHHAVGSKVYKVEIHPPGVQFAPNGMPIFPLFWRNDDGFFGDGDANGDSWLEFDTPADGDYIVRIQDAQGGGGEDHAYRLSLRPPQPDFDVMVAPFRVNVARGSRTPIEVRVRRRDGFDGPVRVAIEGLPAGLSCEPDEILAGEDKIRLALAAGPESVSTTPDAHFAVTGDAELNGTPIHRQGALGPITVSPAAPDLRVKTDVSKIALAPGQSEWLGVTLERSPQFDSRVPIEALNLPFGVRVLDTGLNGILVRQGETERRMQIYAEPWVPPMRRRIYVQALIETQTPQKPQFLSEVIDLTITPAAQVASGR